MKKIKIYDAIVIGMGPAGMAVSAMGSAMGLDILSVEERKIGGECLNVGCIPSKALLKASEINFSTSELSKYGLDSNSAIKTNTSRAMEVVREKADKINNKKMLKTFDKVELILNKGYATFVDKHTIEVAGKEYKAKKIFIGTGTEPFIPPIKGVETIPEELKLTNLNIFEIHEFPKRMTIIGGGAIGTEMAQAFSRLGTKITLIQKDPFLLPNGDIEVGELLKESFEKEGIVVHNSTNISKFEVVDNIIKTYTDKGIFDSEKVLIATGRKPVLGKLNLENAGIKFTNKGITVDQYMRTNIKHIYAIGDANGQALLTHAAMHQGMIALMNAVNPTPFKFKRNNYYVPWTVFTRPEIAQVGMSEKEAKEKKKNVIVLKKTFASYGRAVVDGHPEGFIKVMTNKRGTIFGVTIIGENASEMIHEWILAMQNNLSMFKIMMMQHSFPTLSMLNKMIAEDWMMQKMDSKWIKRFARKFI